MKETDFPIFTALEQLSTAPTVPMHMPGHKRSDCGAAYLKALGARYDITEIDGFDNLHGAEGILKTAMERAARLWGSEAARFLVNGSTCGILAAIRAATHRGDTVLVARNCHKAVYHAIELCGLVPIYLLPPPEETFGFYASLPPKAVGEALNAQKNVALVILTSPTYEGIISDVGAICKAAHRRNIPVLVDEAHGAHLGFCAEFAGGAVQAGADLVVQSLHKTLPSLTQTALLHRSGALVSQRELDRELAVFETSSPSYLLLASMDGCTGLLAAEGTRLFAAWIERIRRFDEAIAGLCRLTVAFHGKSAAQKSGAVYAVDSGKLVISTRGTRLSGPMLTARLRERGIEPEMTASDYVIAMTGAGDSDDALQALAAALIAIDRECEAQPAASGGCWLPRVPERVCGIEQAVRGEAAFLPAAKAAGRVSAEYIWAYPPGIPFVVPGERLHIELIALLAQTAQSGVRIYHSGEGKNGEFLVLTGTE